MNGQTGFYGLSLDVKSETQLKDFQHNINRDDRRRVIIGITIQAHTTSDFAPDGSNLISDTVSKAGYLTLNNYSKNIFNAFPIAAIIKSTEEIGYFAVNIPQVDFNNSFVKFGDTTSVSGKKFQIGFMYID